MAWGKTQNLIGPTGAAGAAGPAGADGAAGPQGPAGGNGSDGAAGGTGPQGEVGPQGPAGGNGADGATGPQGPAGPNAVSADASNSARLGSDGLIYTPYVGSGVIMKNGEVNIGSDGNVWVIFNYGFPSASYFMGVTMHTGSKASLVYTDNIAPDRCMVHIRTEAGTATNVANSFSWVAIYPINPTRSIDEHFLTADTGGYAMPVDDYVEPTVELTP